LAETGQSVKNPFDATGIAWQWFQGCCGASWFIPVRETLPNVCPVEDIDRIMKEINNKNADLSDYSCCKYSTSAAGVLVAEISTTTNWAITTQIVTQLIKTNRGKVVKPQYTVTSTVTIVPESLGYLQIIKMVYQKMEDLFYYKKPDPDDLNRCPILDKLSLSRKKMDDCSTGFGTPVKEDMTKMRTFSCQLGLDLVYLKKLIILPDFSYVGCYPFTSRYLSNTGKKECSKNKDGSVCQKEIGDLMDNYYCCEGE
jgi:hypothetical protein